MADESPSPSAALPPMPRMDLVDLQRLDMELYDLEMRQAQEWQDQLLEERGVALDADDIVHYEDDSLLDSAFIRG